MQNLCCNAIKFSEGSAVLVTVLMEPHEAVATLVLRVDVADSGAGLSAEDCVRVFKPFERASPEKVRLQPRCSAVASLLR